MAKLASVKVWDPFIRLFHWLLAAGVVTAYLVEDRLLGLHAWSGYGLLALLALRLGWGLYGRGYARFDSFIRSPAAILAYLGEIARGHPRRYLGHNPAGGAMVLALLAAVAATALSGIAVYGATEFSGPLAAALTDISPATAQRLEAVHTWLADFTLLLAALHVAGVALASLQHHENLVWAMVTGRKAPLQPPHSKEEPNDEH